MEDIKDSFDCEVVALLNLVSALHPVARKMQATKSAFLLVFITLTHISG